MRFSGAIPLELGSLNQLTALYLNNNALSGEIPPQLANLSSVVSFNLSFNKLSASDATLLSWLAGLQAGWANTQTVPPTNVQVVEYDCQDSVELSWTPILYTGNGGGYEVHYGTNPGGPYDQLGCTTADKTVSGCTVSGLSAGTDYAFVVLSYTPAHGNQQSDLLSDASAEVTATTAAAGFVDCASVSTISTSECEGLVALYNSSNGPGWVNQNNWLSNPDPCSWYGVSCAGGQVQRLDLILNGLSGALPTQLGNLSGLTVLNLRNNALSGSIPAQLGSLTNLTALYLHNNALSGAIPLELGSLNQLTALYLNNNALSGEIPPQLANLSSVVSFNLSFNKLSASDATLLSWLAGLQAGWANTQTVPPTNVQVVNSGQDSVELSWTPILYTGNGGGYEVHYGTNPGGPYDQLGCTTADKTVSGCTVSGLSAGTDYYLRGAELHTGAWQPAERFAQRCQRRGELPQRPAARAWRSSSRMKRSRSSRRPRLNRFSRWHRRCWTRWTMARPTGRWKGPGR